MRRRLKFMTRLPRLPRLPPALIGGAALLALLSALGPAAAQAPDGGSEPVGEPTEDDIQTAYAAALEQVNEGTLKQLGKTDGAALVLTLEDVIKLNCRGMSRAGVHFDCRVERRVRRGDKKPVTDVVQLWLSHEDGEWVAR